MTDSLHAALSALAAGFSGRAGIAATAIDGERSVAVNADELFPTASAIKVFVLYALHDSGLDLSERVVVRDKTLGSGVLAHLDAGLSPTLGDLGVLMMMLSDNTATNLLVDRIGVEKINAAIRAAGLTQTELRGRIDFTKMSEDKAALGVATPAELVRFFVRLRRGELLSAEATERYLDVLRIQKYIEPLRRFLPANPYAREFGEEEPVWVASKTGSLAGVRVECGLVHTPDREWAIAVMTREGKDLRVSSDNEGILLVANASRIVFEAWK